MAAAALSAVSGCGQKSSILFEEPMHNVAMTLSNAHTLAAWADAGAKADVLIRIDANDGLSMFPASLQESMKNTADHLKRGNSAVMNRVAAIVENGGTVNIGMMAGMYKRVIWVIPTVGSVTDYPLDDFKKALMTNRGYPPSELMDLKVSGKHIEGTITGVPLLVTSLEDLELAGETALLDIDLSYFTGVQTVSADYQPGTASLLDFLGILEQKRIPAVMVTLRRGREAPLDIWYYTDVIEEMLAHTSQRDKRIRERYDLMIQAEKALTTRQYAEAESLYTSLTQQRPDKPGLHFSHALALGFLDRGEECRDAMVKAYANDAGYIRGFFQLARVLAANGHIDSGEALLRTSDLEKTIPKEEMDYQWGLFYMEAGLYQEAVSKIFSVTSKRKKDFAARTVLYRAYAELGEKGHMLMVLKELVELDRDRVVRDMPWVFRKLGDLSFEMHLDPDAAKWYKQYLELVPDDPDSSKMREIIETWEGVDRSPKILD
jgi:tetratricopeptide (TPR) repeat protein